MNSTYIAEKPMQRLEASSPQVQSADLVGTNIEQLKALFPELITEGTNGATVNVDVLKALVATRLQLMPKRSTDSTGTANAGRANWR